VNRRFLGLLLLGGLVAASGASCPKRAPEGGVLPPEAFAAPPTLEQVIQAVNTNSAPVRQLQAEGATLSVEGLPPLKAKVVMERPRRFRLVGEFTQMTGPEIDLGSNDELLWMWVKRAPQSAVYYARHEQLHLSPATQMLPIDPAWLMEALGAAYLDPLARHEGPFQTGDRRLEIRSRVFSPRGEMSRVTFVDDKYGYVVEQRLHDPSGRLVAVAQASEHRHYPELRVTLPHRVQVKLPPAQMAFAFDVSRYAINQLSGDPVNIFAMPQVNGYPLIDLADPRLLAPGQSIPPAPAVHYSTVYPGDAGHPYSPSGESAPGW
jgi:hypothetical protein